MSDRAPGGATLWLRWAALAMLAVACVMLFALSRHTFSNSIAAINHGEIQLDREEGFLLNQAMQLRAGTSIYPSVSRYPFTIGNYTPLYPAAYALTLFAAEPTLAPGRAMVLAASIALCLLMAAFVFFETRAILPALLAPALFLTTYDLNDWIRFARVDLPAIALGFAGFVLATRERWRLALPFAILAFLLAVFTKQTQLIAPVAVGLAMLLKGQYRKLVLFAAPMLIMGGAVAALLLLFTGGEFLRHTVAYNQNEFHWGQVWIWTRHFWRFEYLVLIALGVAAIALTLPGAGEAAHATPAVEDDDEEPDANDAPIGGLSLTIFLILSAVGAVSIGKDGAASNYLLELQAVLAVSLAVALGKLLSRDASQGMGPVALAAVASLLVLVHAAVAGSARERAIIFGKQVGSPALRDSTAALTDVLRGAPGDILTEFPMLAIAAGKDVLFQPYIMSTLAREGKWDQAPFVGDILDQRFSIILSSQDLRTEGRLFGFTEAMKTAVLISYDLRGRLALGDGQHVFVYMPSYRRSRDLTPIT